MKQFLTRLLPILFLFCGAVNAAQTDSILVLLEEPEDNVSYASISNLRGWAVAPSGIDRIELFVDDKYADTIPYGGSRGDVGNAYSSYPNAGKSGFSMAYNYKGLSAGEHTIMVRAYDNNGDYNDSASTFTVKKFNSAYIADDSGISIANVTSFDAMDNKTFKLEGVEAEGDTWSVVLGWNRATQGFEIQEITRTQTGSGGDTSCPDFSGNWRGTVKFTTVTYIEGTKDVQTENMTLNYTISQTNCSVTIRNNLNNYVDTGTVNAGTNAVVLPNDISEDTIDLIESLLASEGIYATVTITSNQHSMTFEKTSSGIDVDGDIDMAGKISANGVTLDFSVDMDIDGSLTKY